MALNARIVFFATSTIPPFDPGQSVWRGGWRSDHRQQTVHLRFVRPRALRIRPAALGTSAFSTHSSGADGQLLGRESQAIDPLINTPFPNNQIPINRLDPAAAKLIAPNFMPLPNGAGGVLGRYFRSCRITDQGLSGVDYNTGRHTLEMRYNYNYATQVSTAGQVPSYQPLDQTMGVHSAEIGDTFVIRPNLLNQGRVSFSIAWCG